VNEGVLTICLKPIPAPPGVTAPTPPAAAAAATADDRAKPVCGELKAPVGRDGASSAAAVLPAAEGVSAPAAAALVLLEWLRGAPLGVRGVVMVDSAAGGSRSSLSSSESKTKTAEVVGAADQHAATISMAACVCCRVGYQDIGLEPVPPKLWMNYSEGRTRQTTYNGPQTTYL
jgi:hypothetical protein